jgi:hypothetical protein
MSVEALAVRVHRVGHKGKFSGLAIYWEDAKSMYMRTMGCRGGGDLKERRVSVGE